MNTEPSVLPVDSVKAELLGVLRRDQPVVLTAPTGSGKSTQVPRWCAESGSVLVIEPRRVACRGLAQRVAELEGVNLGGKVGYSVRDDNRAGPSTRILFATPGVVLRWIVDREQLDFNTIILDEFHERSLDVDLLLAIFKLRHKGGLVVMSATMNASALCRHLNGRHIHAEGRVFPVEFKYIKGPDLLPDSRGLEERLHQAVERARGDDGDILVFLPGKAEIARAFDRLFGLPSFEVLQIHGGLSLKEQSRVFAPSSVRRIILATNVAETSITIPGIGVVIDSGLVRRTRYLNGRGYLTLVAVARDSADQRSGRAGRTAPGVSYRLWSSEAVLEPGTPPEIHRESLASLLLAAAACDERIDDLPFLDFPKDYALDSARADLRAIGVINSDDGITHRGRQLFGLPLDAPLGSLIVEAELLGCLEDAIDLVSGLSVGRPIFSKRSRPTIPEDDLRRSGCDATAVIRAIREGEPRRHMLNEHVLLEARSVSRRLRKAWNLPDKGAVDAPVSRDLLVEATLRSDKRCAYVARRRKGKFFWGNGGTEIDLARESAVDEEKNEAVVVLASMAIGVGLRNRKVYGTCAMPVKFRELTAAGLGEERIEHVARPSSGVVTALISRVYAGKTIHKREGIPKGRLAKEAVGALFLEGRIHRKSRVETEGRLLAASLYQRLLWAGLADKDMGTGAWNLEVPVPALEEWIHAKLSELGLESGEDLGLLSAEDFLAPDLPETTRQWLDKHFKLELHLGDADYLVEYDLQKKEVTLVKTDGARKDPPSLSVLPSFRGFKIRVRHHSKVWVLRS